METQLIPLADDGQEWKVTLQPRSVEYFNKESDEEMNMELTPVAKYDHGEKRKSKTGNGSATTTRTRIGQGRSLPSTANVGPMVDLNGEKDNNTMENVKPAAEHDTGGVPAVDAIPKANGGLGAVLAENVALVVACVTVDAPAVDAIPKANGGLGAVRAGFASIRRFAVKRCQECHWRCQEATESLFGWIKW